MLIRKNTKAFKTIKEIITSCKDKSARQSMIRLYITRAGHSINDRISVESIEGDAELFYDMNYDMILNNLESPTRQLQQSDELPGIYFFRNASNKLWDETPFEFDEQIIKEFASLPELPVVRKKEKATKFVLADANVSTGSKHHHKETARKEKPATTVSKGPKQPDYKLKHQIEFSNLDKLVFRTQQVSKKDVLDYYNRTADFILPYLKDRAISLHAISKSGKNSKYKTIDALSDEREIPDWALTGVNPNKKANNFLLCKDKDHLVFYVEAGSVQFDCCPSRTASLDRPDYIVIGIESPESELGRAIDVALAAKEILSGLQLPSFVKSDGQSSLDIYIPLDSKSNFDTSKTVAEFVCKLIRLKIPETVVLEAHEGNTYGKVALNYLYNDAGKSVVAPYSLVIGESPTVATPLLWDEVKEGLNSQEFNLQTIQKRLQRIGDPFETLFKKKVNADELLKRLNTNYSFLF